MTILLTVLGLCLVALLVWLGITSYKLMKFKKKAEGAFKHLERWIDDNHNLVYKELETKDNENQKKFDEVTRLGQNLHTNVYHDIDTHVANLNSKLDSRCDKLYALMKETQKDVENLKVKNIEGYQPVTINENPSSSEKAWNLT